MFIKLTRCVEPFNPIWVNMDKVLNMESGLNTVLAFGYLEEKDEYLCEDVLESPEEIMAMLNGVEKCKAKGIGFCDNCLDGECDERE